MNDLISRQDAIDSFDGTKVSEEYCTEYDIGYNDGIDFAISKISVFPSADRPKGEWIAYKGIQPPELHGKHYCSNCYHTIHLASNGNVYNYCPNCGVKMEVEHE